MRAPRARRRSAIAAAALVVVAGLLIGLAGPSAASGPDAASPPAGWASAAQIDRFVQQERRDLKLSGLAVVVVSKRSVVFQHAYGDAAPGGPAVTLSTPFVLGSTSKQFTGLAIQQLIAQGRLSLDDTVGMRLGALGGEISRFAEVTIEQLLSHTSGISTNDGTRDVFDPAPSFTALSAEAKQLLRGVPATKPGTTFEYSNGNYTLLGSIVEAVTGQSFESALQTLVAEPLGLSGTTSDLQLAQRNGLAVGHYTWLRAIDSTTPGPRWPMGAPSAYTSSTAADLTRLLRAELGESSGIDPAVFAAAQAPLTRVDDYNTYASGWYQRTFWELHDDDKNFTDPTLPKLYEHEGDTSRETSYLAFAPDLGFGVAVLSNTGLGTDNQRINDFIYRLLHTIVGTSARPRDVSPLIAAAPLVMVAVPLLQLLALALLLFVRPWRGRFARWVPGIAAGVVTVVTLLVAFVVVPGQTQQPLLDRVWWSGVPDLAVSVAVSLALAVACVGAGIASLARRRGATRRNSV